MRLISIFFIIVIFLHFSKGQELEFVSCLESTINETSGLIYINNKLITHNDSGGKSCLYEIDTTSGNVTREITIGNAENIDWEDICADSLSIFIADFGNNNGSRTDLKIYVVNISDYLNTPNDTVYAETIDFSYSDQTNFTSSPYITNFDAEAVISFKDSLYIFTKNWGDLKTNIYSIPKQVGSYQIEKLKTVDVQGLITGACYDLYSKTIILTGYNVFNAFIVEIYNSSSNMLSIDTFTKFDIHTEPGSSFQIEGITVKKPYCYFLSSEKNSPDNPTLFSLDRTPIDFVNYNSEVIQIFPNPIKDFFFIKGISSYSIQLFDINGILRKITYSSPVSVHELSGGIYFIKISNRENEIIYSTRIMIQH